MRELREDTFPWNKNNDAHEHVERILDIVSLFNILGVTHDVVLLRVFSITLTGAAKRWVDRLPPGTINTWDLLKKAFIHRKVSNGSSNRIAAIISKLDGLGRDMKKLKENVHVIQVGCETCGGAYLNKECPLHEEVIFANNEAPTDETSSNGTNELYGVSFIFNDNVHISKETKEGPSKVLPCQLPPKELSPGSFTLLCTIGSLNIYAMADVGSNVNIMPRSMFNHLKLTNLKETSILVEMVDMTKMPLWE
ncbi:phospholipase-like protein [Tanacetum coccineum]